MLFNSHIFIMFFWPITLIGYFGLNRFNQNTLAKAFLLAMSLWFYGYFNYWYLLVIISSVIVNYLVAKAMNVCDGRFFTRKQLLFIGLAFDLGMLFYFKYFDFFISNINTVFRTNFNLHYILLPLGISFFTFQQISYIVDVYKEDARCESFLDYAVFITFFPQLIAGPIVTHDEFLPQLKDESKRHINYENMSKGLMMFSLGLCKKVILADVFGGIVDWGYKDVSALSSLESVLVMFSYTMQIYFDFSAYSDMATGIGHMFNIDLPMNFNSPYKSYDIVDFWSRWHMTLTRFLRKYVYFPLGGNRLGKKRTYLNILIVFLVSGLWHGAAWTFILWGAIHGLANIFIRHFKSAYGKLHKAFQWLINFSFINLTWMLFRADSISDVKCMIHQLIFGGLSLSSDMGIYFDFPEFDFVTSILKISKYTDRIRGCGMLSFYAVAFFIVLVCENVQNRKYKLNVINLLMTVFLLIWGISSLSGVMTFLYFNF